MKAYNIRTRRNAVIRLTAVMLVCTGMIAAACWFAYRHTAGQVRRQLHTTVTELSTLPAAVPETALTRPAMTAPVQTTARPVTTTTAAPVTAAPQTQAAAVIFAPEETTTQTVSAMQLPVRGEIIQPYSHGDLVKSPTTGVWQTHNGVDIGCTAGDPVYPAAAGTVQKVEEDALWGVCVTIVHENGMESRYCGLAADLEVTEGDAVAQTDVIGAAGSTADCESALAVHVHFEVKQGGKYLDPAALCGAA